MGGRQTSEPAPTRPRSSQGPLGCFRPNTYSRIIQGTPADPLDTIDATTVNAARELEAAEKTSSEMSTVAAPIESATSVLSGTDNPIPLLDWISSLLKSLEKFNGIVDKIATVRISITLCSASQSMLTRCLDSSS